MNGSCNLELNVVEDLGTEDLIVSPPYLWINEDCFVYSAYELDCT
jgi:hypothetical protein